MTARHSKPPVITWRRACFYFAQFAAVALCIWLLIPSSGGHHSDSLRKSNNTDCCTSLPPATDIDNSHALITTVKHAKPEHVVRYTVRRGDTLTKIAKEKYGNPDYWPVIYWANKIKYADVIYVGQNLRIPPKTRRIPAPPRILAPAPPKVFVHSTDGNARPVTTVSVESGSIQSFVSEVFGSGSGCADEILHHESGLSWADVTIENPSGAYGLPQALPGYKMESAGSDWATDPLTQLRWMLGYADSTYGGICPAAEHDLGTGTY